MSTPNMCGVPAFVSEEAKKAVANFASSANRDMVSLVTTSEGRIEMVSRAAEKALDIGPNNKHILRDADCQQPYSDRKPFRSSAKGTNYLTSREILASMQHDPLVELINLHRRLERTLEWHEALREGRCETPGHKYSDLAYRETLALMQKNNNDLLRYGYGRVSETLEVEMKVAPLLEIELTTADTFYADAIEGFVGKQIEEMVE